MLALKAATASLGWLLEFSGREDGEGKSMDCCLLPVPVFATPAAPSAMPPPCWLFLSLPKIPDIVTDLA